MNTKLKVVRIVGQMVTLAFDPSSSPELLSAHISKGAGDKTVEFKFQNPHQMFLGQTVDIRSGDEVPSESFGQDYPTTGYSEKTNLGNIGALKAPTKLDTNTVATPEQIAPPTKEELAVLLKKEQVDEEIAFEAELAKETAQLEADKEALETLEKTKPAKTLVTEQPALDATSATTPAINNNPQPGAAS